MSGIYKRINIILKFIKPNLAYDSFAIWAALAHPNNKILDLKHQYKSSYYVNESEKMFIQKGDTYQGFLNKEVLTTSIPLTEVLAHQVYRALEEVALTKIEEAFQLEQQKKIKRDKIKYLNKQLYPQSVSFILED